MIWTKGHTNGAILELSKRSRRDILNSIDFKFSAMQIDYSLEQETHDKSADSSHNTSTHKGAGESSNSSGGSWSRVRRRWSLGCRSIDLLIDAWDNDVGGVGTGGAGEDTSVAAKGDVGALLPSETRFHRTHSNPTIFRDRNMLHGWQCTWRDLRYREHCQFVQKSQPGYSRSDHPEHSSPQEEEYVGDREYHSLSRWGAVELGICWK